MAIFWSSQFLWCFLTFLPLDLALKSSILSIDCDGEERLWLERGFFT